jgi:hypothetical protein
VDPAGLVADEFEPVEELLEPVPDEFEPAEELLEPAAAVVGLVADPAGLVAAAVDVVDTTNHLPSSPWPLS